MTNVDDSEDSEDSLPLEVPKKSSPVFKKQSSTPPRAKNVRGPTTSWSFRNELEEHEEISPPPPPQKSGSPHPGRRGRGGGGSATGKSANASAGLQRTKHGSPYPGRRGVKQGLIHTLVIIIALYVRTSVLHINVESKVSRVDRA